VQFVWLALATVFFIVIVDFKYSALPEEYKHRPNRICVWLWMVWDWDVNDRFECACLLVGWLCLLTRPGIAAFRTLRIFRYIAITASNNVNIAKLSPVYKAFWFVGRRTRFYCLKLQQEIMNSMFVPIAVVYYMLPTVLVGAIMRVIFYDVLGHSGVYEQTANVCDTLSHCIYTHFRLSVLDENALDYVEFMLLSDSQLHLYAIIPVCYMLFVCVCVWPAFIGLFAECLFKPLHVLVVPVHKKEHPPHTHNEEDEEEDEAGLFVRRGSNNKIVPVYADECLQLVPMKRRRKLTQQQKAIIVRQIRELLDDLKNLKQLAADLTVIVSALQAIIAARQQQQPPKQPQAAISRKQQPSEPPPIAAGIFTPNTNPQVVAGGDDVVLESVRVDTHRSALRDAHNAASSHTSPTTDPASTVIGTGTGTGTGGSPAEAFPYNIHTPRNKLLPSINLPHLQPHPHTHHHHHHHHHHGGYQHDDALTAPQDDQQSPAMTTISSIPVNTRERASEMYRQRLPADLDMSKLAMRPVPSAMDVFLEPPLESSDGSNNGDNATAVVAGNEQSSRPSTSRSIHTPRGGGPMNVFRPSSEQSNLSSKSNKSINMDGGSSKFLRGNNEQQNDTDTAPSMNIEDVYAKHADLLENVSAKALAALRSDSFMPPMAVAAEKAAGSSTKDTNRGSDAKYAPVVSLPSADNLTPWRDVNSVDVTKVGNTLAIPHHSHAHSHAPVAPSKEQQQESSNSTKGATIVDIKEQEKAADAQEVVLPSDTGNESTEANASPANASTSVKRTILDKLTQLTPSSSAKIPHLSQFYRRPQSRHNVHDEQNTDQFGKSLTFKYIRLHSEGASGENSADHKTDGQEGAAGSNNTSAAVSPSKLLLKAQSVSSIDIHAASSGGSQKAGGGTQQQMSPSQHLWI
jgi:hypothetical protein